MAAEVTGRRHAAQDVFRVLFVCTANKCRSPLAEYLLRDALRRHWPEGAATWDVSSVGVTTRGGRPMDSKSLDVLAERGIDGSDFVNRRLTPVIAHEADLILTATREHRGQVAFQDPGVLGRMFTINQFGYLLTSLPSVSGPIAGDPPGDPIVTGFDLIATAGLARTQIPARTLEDDLPDPVGKPLAHFRRCADTLEANIAAMIAALGRS